MKSMKKRITNSGVKSNKVWLGGDRFDIKRSKKIEVDITGAKPLKVFSTKKN